ncbi:transposase [Mycetohabitans sp. B8]|nr:transposase [Mycetohabitans sp. B8]
MAKGKISNEWWAVLEPLIPAFTLSPKGGHRRTVDERAALNGIPYVLHTGVAW